MLSPNGIRAILFDLDGTLRHNQPSSNQVFWDFAGSLGVESSLERRWEAARWTHRYWASSPELNEDLQEYAGDQDLFWTNYAHRHLLVLRCESNSAEKLAPVIHQYMKELHKPVDYVPLDVPETLAALKRAGFLLGVLSNRSESCDAQLEQLGLYQYFSFSLVAGEVAAWKPDPQIFQQALLRSGTQPEQTLYVGDNYYADIIGARQAGLHPVLIDPERVFPEADCPTIRTLGELPVVLENLAQRH